MKSKVVKENMVVSVSRALVPTRFNFINLGAGVQSSTMALMAARGEILPLPDGAIFADTMSEPSAVYSWLDWLETQLPFPVYRESRGDLRKDALTISHRKDGKGSYVRTLLPTYIRLFNGKSGIMQRICTADYKVFVILKFIKAFLISHNQNPRTNYPLVTQWFGISWDEMLRMRDSHQKYTQHRYPLIEKRMSRFDCLEWIKKNNYPEPPRSACYFCPFRSNDNWRTLKEKHPADFAKAVSFDYELRRLQASVANPSTRGIHYLHRSAIPLDMVDFRSQQEKGQMDLFGELECTGTCGV